MGTHAQDAIRSVPQAHCALCGSAGQTVYRDLRDRLFGSPGAWHLSACTNPDCRLLWLDPRPLEADIARAYQHYYTHHAGEPHQGPLRLALSGALRLLVGASLALTGLRREHRAVKSMHLAGRTPGALLEIGCGEGSFLADMANRGWRVEGIEFDEDAAALARQRHGLTVRTGLLEEMRLAESSYDAITMNHVLEHLFRPLEMLTECLRLLKPGGLLVIVTPNADGWGRRHYGPNWRGLEPPRHIQIFTPQALAGAARRVGLEPLRVYTTVVNAWQIDSASRCLAAAAADADPLASLRSPRILLAAIATQTWLAFMNRRAAAIGEECVLVAQRGEDSKVPHAPAASTVCGA